MDHTTWARKAEILKVLYKKLLFQYHEYDAPQIVKRVMSLSPLFGRKCCVGFESRPKFLMEKATEVSILENFSSYCLEGGTGTAPANRLGNVSHILQYVNLRIRPIIRDRDVDKCQELTELYKAKKNRRRLRGKQKVIYVHT